MTLPDGQVAAAGEPVICTAEPAVAPEPASGVPQLQAPSAASAPLSHASASPPDRVAANSSACPDPLSTTAGTPRRLAGLPARVIQPLQALPFQWFAAAVPAAVMQYTSTPRPRSAMAAGLLAQLPPMFCHALQRKLPFGRRWCAVTTLPPVVVWYSATVPLGVSTAAGSEPAFAGRGGRASALAHSQSFGNPACCQPCSTRPAAFRANTVSRPSAWATAAGLLTMLVGDSPTV